MAAECRSPCRKQIKGNDESVAGENPRDAVLHRSIELMLSVVLAEAHRVVCANVTYRSADRVNRSDYVVACRELNLRPRTSSTNAAKDPNWKDWIRCTQNDLLHFN